MGFIDENSLLSVGTKKPTNFELAMQIVRLIHNGGDVVGFVAYIRSLGVPTQPKMEATND